MKRIISLALMLVMLSGIFSMGGACSANYPFTDVKSGAWYESAVATAYYNGIMEGKGNGKFEPMAFMTRAELVTVLCRLSRADCSGKGALLDFSDTSPSAWYADYVGWARDTGIVAGYEDNTFRPNAPVKRSELAVFIGRFMSHKRIRSTNKPLVDSFADAEKIPQWAKTELDKVRKSGLVEGDDKGNFNPSASATRAEIAKIAVNLFSLVELNDRCKRFNLQKEFLYSDDSPDVPIAYRIYLPEDYSEDKEYPLLVYLHGNGGQGDDNKRHLEAVAKCFYSPYSPAFDSIVVVPQCPRNQWWHGEPVDRVAQLMDYINERYSTDMSRQYVMGHSMGGDGTWQMLINHPEKVSAAVPVAGTGITFNNNNDGIVTPINVNDEMLKIPTCIVYDNDDVFSGGDYNRMVYGVLKNMGAQCLTYYETSGFGHGICDCFIGFNDISILEWLYEQERMTN